MFGVTTSDDYRPVAWMGRYPVDVTTMLVGVHVAAAILAAILVAFGAGSVLLWLQFDSAAIWSTGEVCWADSGRRLHVSTPGLSRLERSDGAVDEHWRRIPFCRTEWCRPGARLVECSENTVRFTAQVSCPPETTSAHRRQPLRIGRRLHVN